DAVEAGKSSRQPLMRQVMVVSRFSLASRGPTNRPSTVLSDVCQLPRVNLNSIRSLGTSSNKTLMLYDPSACLLNVSRFSAGSQRLKLPVMYMGSLVCDGGTPVT